MRKSGGLLIPLALIVTYYGFWVGLMAYLLSRYPVIGEYFPIGGISYPAASNVDTFQPIYSSVDWYSGTSSTMATRRLGYSLSWPEVTTISPSFSPLRIPAVSSRR